jgi:EmrB/QacA subfamily drug resistance transporter
VAITVTTVGALMSTLDDRILVIGLPTVTRELGATVEQGIWVTQAYLLSTTIVLLMVGRTADVVGRVKLYNVGFAVFTFGSALSAISPDPYELITGRLIQGVGAGMLSANSLAIVADATPTNQLGQFIGFNQLASRVGSVTGYVLTGFVLAFTTWRALFLINVPIGIFGTVWAHYRLRELATKDVVKTIDWPGFLTITPALVLILLAITFFGYGSAQLSVSSGMLALGLALLVTFVLVERRSKAPLLDLNLLRNREFSLGNISNAFNSLSWNAMLYMISFYLQVVMGLSPLQAGIGVLPLEATFLLVGPISGRLADRYGSRIFTSAGPIVSSISCFAAATFSSTTPYPQVALSVALLGVGMGLYVSPNARAIISSVPPHRRGVATALRSTLTYFSATLGPGLAITIMTIAVPYQTITTLLYQAGTSPGTVAMDEFVSGFRLAVTVLGAIFATEAVFSYSRWIGKGPEIEHVDEKASQHKRAQDVD